MSYESYLKELLRPLGVYRLDGTANGAELESIATAKGMGLLEKLLPHKPMAATEERRRAALAALLRVGGDSFTLSAVNDNLAGCGINAVASEPGRPGRVEIRFPDVPGIPDGFEELQRIIEDILPCHLEITYVYWYVTWAMLEEKFKTWGALEARGLSWGEIEKLVK